MILMIDNGLIILIQSILLIISTLLIIIASIGVLKIDGDLCNVVYARIHILSLFDIACIIAFIALGQPLFALIYLFLSPLLAHALANAYFHGEDINNNPVLNPIINNTLKDDVLEETLDEEFLVLYDDYSQEDLDLSKDSIKLMK